MNPVALSFFFSKSLVVDINEVHLLKYCICFFFLETFDFTSFERKISHFSLNYVSVKVLGSRYYILKNYGLKTTQLWVKTGQTWVVFIQLVGLNV